MKRREHPVTGTGASSVLMVFVVLCLVVFAVLSFSSADADLRLSRQFAERTTAYYQAENRANDRIKEIDGNLQEPYNNREEFSFSENVDETGRLEVVLKVRDSENETGQHLQIVKWQSVTEGEWNPDRTLPVMKR